MVSVEPFNIMIKPASSMCNLDCVYCYYKTKSKELYGTDAVLRMSDDLLEDFTVQYIRAMPEVCTFNWQGGEPLIAGLDFFRKAVGLQKKHTGPNQLIGNNIQTNGTLLSEEWCRFFRDNQFLVGISIDGPETLHNKFRRDVEGQGTFLPAWKGLELLRKHGVEFNVLVTLNSENTPKGKEIYQFLVNQGIRHMQFIPVIERKPNGTIAGFSCSPRHLESFLVDVYSCWKDRDVGKVSVRFIDDLLYYLFYGQSPICCNSRNCAHAFVLEWNGDLFACDHFVFKDWLIGNIRNQPLGKLIQSPMVERFAGLKTDLPKECRKCNYLQYCNGGCPKHHVPMGTKPGRVNYFCQAYKIFFAAALDELKNLAGVIKSGNAAKEPAPPAERSFALRKKVGRNDPCPCGSGRKYKLCCGT